MHTYFLVPNGHPWKHFWRQFTAGSMVSGVKSDTAFSVPLSHCPLKWIWTFILMEARLPGTINDMQSKVFVSLTLKTFFFDFQTYFHAWNKRVKGNVTSYSCHPLTYYNIDWSSSLCLPQTSWMCITLWLSTISKLRREFQSRLVLQITLWIISPYNMMPKSKWTPMSQRSQRGRKKVR